MKYYLDTEFIECAKQRRVLGIKVGPPVPTIDLISLALVAEDGREFYALNAECELAYAWASDWVRQHVLAPIWEEYAPKYMRGTHLNYFSFEAVQDIFREHGRTREQLAGDIVAFVYPMQLLADELNKVLRTPGCTVEGSWQGECLSGPGVGEYYDRGEALDWAKATGAQVWPEFYGYYCDYDWVVLCQLFGRMLDLAKGFPMYCRDLKQELDRLGITQEQKQQQCPKPVNEHNALADARWNKQLHAVLKEHAAKIGEEIWLIHEALRDLREYTTAPEPKDLGKIIFALKSHSLKQSNQLRELEHYLRIPALEKQGSVIEKVRFMMATLKRAAQGEKISNKPEDYY